MRNTNNTDIQNLFTQEIQELVDMISADPVNAIPILVQLDMVKDNALITNNHAIRKLCLALQGVYAMIADKKIDYTDTLKTLISAVTTKMLQLVTTDADDSDIPQYIAICDSAASGGIFDIQQLSKPSVPVQPIKQKTEEDKQFPLQLKDANELLNIQEELLSFVMKMNSEVDHLQSKSDKDLLHSDLKIIEKKITNAHHKLFSIIGADSVFLTNHQTVHGFFINVNDKKYFISAQYITDVISQSELDYVIKDGQHHLVLEKDDEELDENVKKEYIPIYALSSLFPDQKITEKPVLDIVMIAEYMHQKIAIIANGVKKFAMPVKKQLPASFANCSMLEGVVFDEHYDMIPILSLPAILKRFRAQRSYEEKVFEANTKPRTYKILVVDDSEKARSILKGLLTNNKFIVEQAIDGIAAIELLKKKQYDVIITDDAMPRMNGEILVDNVRRMENYKNVPVIAVAATPIAQANAFINKADFDRTDLLQTIRRLLYE